MLVGRERERERLVEALAGGPATVLLEGEAGIGKSALLAAALPDDLPVRRARALASERDRALGVLTQLLPEITGTAGALGPGSALSAVIEQSVELLERRSEVLVVEDLHQADDASVHVLASLVAQVPLVLLATLRPSPRPEPLRRLVDQATDRGHPPWVLEPLDDRAVAQLAEGLLGGPAPEQVLAACARAGGNPLYVTELLGALAEGPVPVEVPSLRLVVLRRLGHLSPEGLALLSTAAVLGVAFEVADLAAATGESVTSLLPRLEEARRAGALHEDGALLAFRHELVRDAVYDDLPLAVRRGLHTQVGRALAEAGAPAARVASHLHLGAEPGDTETIRWLRRAAEDALDVSPATSAELLRRALDLCGDHHPEREEVLAQLVPVLGWSHGRRAAEEQARHVLDRLPPGPTRRRVHYVLAEAVFFQGRLDEAHRELETLLADPDLSGPEKVMVLGRTCHTLLARGERLEAVSRAHACLALAGDDRPAQRIAHLVGASVDLELGDLPAAEQHARAAARLANVHEPRAVQLAPQALLAQALLEQGDLDGCRRALEELARLASDFPGAPAWTTYHRVQGELAWQQGRWDEVGAHLETALQVGAETGAPAEEPVLGLLALLALHRGSPGRGASGLWQAGLDVAASDAADLAGIDASAVRDAPLAWLQHLGCEVVVAARRLSSYDVLDALVGRASELVGVPGAAVLLALAAGDDPVPAARRCARGPLLPRVLELTGEVEALREAALLYEALGATRSASRVRQALRDRGVRDLGRVPRTGATVGWDSLTASERKVVDLVCEGLTSREVGERLYLSRRTVDTHLAHVYQKLGIRSRTELVAQALRVSAPS